MSHSRLPRSAFASLSTRCLSLLVVLALTTPGAGLAADPDADGVTSVEEEGSRRFRLFPPRSARKGTEAREAERSRHSRREPEPVEVATEVETPEGIWEWVDKMDGEIPSPEQVEALEEHEEEELAEQAVIEEAVDAREPALVADPTPVYSADDPLYLQQIDLSEFDIPIDVNPSVVKWMEYITGNGRKYYTKWLARSTRFRPMMIAELEKAGLPKDLVYLSMVESGYSTHAYSHAAAAGLWQFIPSTAKLYKLRVDWWVDERRDPEMSLHAAIDFLGELNTMFGDWRLAWASYNTGPGRVRRAVSRTGSRDFWKLVAAKELPAETSNYVPMIMAAAIIGKHPERYGFSNIEYQEELVYDVQHVEGSVELEILARCAGTTLSEIKALNPALRRHATPPEGAVVRLPVGTKAQFAAALAEIPAERRVTVARHTVARGETLSVIANRYGVSVSDISRANGLKNVNRITVGMSLVVPRSDGSEPPPAQVAESRPTPAPAPSAPSTYTVRKGDTLSGIAARYGVSVGDLQARNDLKGSTIVPGQRLALRGGGGSAAPAAAATTRTYTVKTGDSLSVIAARNGVSVADIQRWNRIGNASHIKVGQKLTLHGAQGGGGGGGGGGWKSYLVKPGDSLGEIASRSRCTVAELREWNDLRSTVIHPGQTLRVKM